MTTLIVFGVLMVVLLTLAGINFIIGEHLRASIALVGALGVFIIGTVLAINMDDDFAAKCERAGGEVVKGTTCVQKGAVIHIGD